MKYQRTFLALSLLTNLSLTSFLVIDKQPVKELTPDEIVSEVPAVDGFAVKRDTFFYKQPFNLETKIVDKHKTTTTYGRDTCTLTMSNDTLVMSDKHGYEMKFSRDTNNDEYLIKGTEITPFDVKSEVTFNKKDSSIMVSLYVEENNSIRLKLTKQR